MARVTRHPRVAKREAAIIRTAHRAVKERRRKDFIDAAFSGAGLLLSGITLGMMLAKWAIGADNKGRVE